MKRITLFLLTILSVFTLAIGLINILSGISDKFPDNVIVNLNNSLRICEQENARLTSKEIYFHYIDTDQIYNIYNLNLCLNFECNKLIFEYDDFLGDIVCRCM